VFSFFFVLKSTIIVFFQLCNLPLNCHYDVIKLHYKYHAGAREHTCTACGLAFMEARTLRKHERVHLGPLPATTAKSAACHICGKLVVKANMKSHIRARHREEEDGTGGAALAAVSLEQFSCLLCGHATKTSWTKV
jgi:hypothetical protein